MFQLAKHKSSATECKPNTLFFVFSYVRQIQRQRSHHLEFLSPVRRPELSTKYGMQIGYIALVLGQRFDLKHGSKNFCLKLIYFFQTTVSHVDCLGRCLFQQYLKNVIFPQCFQRIITLSYSFSILLNYDLVPIVRQTFSEL